MFQESLNLLRFHNKKIKLDTIKQEMTYNEDFSQRHANIAIKSTTTSAYDDIIEFLKKNNDSNFKMPTNPSISKSSKLLYLNNEVSSQLSGSILEIIGGGLEIAVGKKIWVFILITLVFFSFCICCCFYWCCCFKCRNFLCCKRNGKN